MALPPKVAQGVATPISEIPFFPMGRHLSETVGAALFEPSVEARATYILAQAIAENIRFTIDEGQPPTAAIGFQLVASDPPLLIPIGGEIVIRFFGEAAGAILQYQFGRA